MDWIISDKWLPLIQDVLLPVVLIIGCVLLYSLCRRGLKMLQTRGALAPQVISILRIVIRWLFIVLVVVVILSTFGILENAWAAFVAIIAMVATGFVAMWSVLSNIFCTLLVLIYKPFQVGDIISLPSEKLEGEVTDLNLMFTTLTSKDGEIIQVPNNQFFQKPIRRIPRKKGIDLYEQLKKPSEE